MTEWVKGKTPGPGRQLKNSQIADELALPPVKIHCSILAEDAIKAAVDDYRQQTPGAAAMSREPEQKRPGTVQHVNVTRRGIGQGRACAWGQDHRLLGPGLQARIRGRGRPRKTSCLKTTASRCCRPQSLAYLDGTELDFVREGLNEGSSSTTPTSATAAAAANVSGLSAGFRDEPAAPCLAVLLPRRRFRTVWPARRFAQDRAGRSDAAGKTCSAGAPRPLCRTGQLRSGWRCNGRCASTRPTSA